MRISLTVYVAVAIASALAGLAGRYWTDIYQPETSNAIRLGIASVALERSTLRDWGQLPRHTPCYPKTGLFHWGRLCSVWMRGGVYPFERSGVGPCSTIVLQSQKAPTLLE